MITNPKIFVVIPCLAESGIIDTIESLRKNSGYKSQISVIIVINHSQSESPEKKKLNYEIAEKLEHSLEKNNSEKIEFKIISVFDWLDKKAGVGMARKTGMDFAVDQLKQINAINDGVLVCLDGDCTVAENYLQELERYFTNSNNNGCSIYFEHPLDQENPEAIIDYELYLRFYMNALRWSGFPFAFQTVGSSMAVSATAYVKQGGMNTRKAGEDFYFLNKIIQLENFGDLNTTTVYPSPRKSDRVPFGTGREMMEWEVNRHLLAYSPELIKQLKEIFNHVNLFRESVNPIETLKNEIDVSVYDCLIRLNFNENIFEIKSHTASASAFRKRFFNWMSAFQIMKLLNELSLSSFPKKPIYESAQWLWKELSTENPSSITQDLLMQYRNYDRLNAKQI